MDKLVDMGWSVASIVQKKSSGKGGGEVLRALSSVATPGTHIHSVDLAPRGTLLSIVERKDVGVVRRDGGDEEAEAEYAGEEDSGALSAAVLARQSAHLRILRTKRVAENASQTRFTYNLRSRAFSATHLTDENSQLVGLTGTGLGRAARPPIRTTQLCTAHRETCG